MILGSLIWFLVLTVLYHILVTVIWFGIFGWAFPQLPSLLRDGVRILMFLISTISFWKLLPGYWKRRKYAWLSFIWLCIFSVWLSWLKDKSFYDMFVWFKYGFQYISFFLMATVMWRIMGKKDTTGRVKRFFEHIPLWLSIVVAFGFVWQWAKLLRPNLFLSLWYGPLNDFYFGAKPPLYYLTGLHGTLRWQGIFAWPNNYGYFLIVFFPLILKYYGLKVSERKSRFTKQHILAFAIHILWIAAIGATLSRAALIGVLVIFALTQINRWKSHKKWAYGLWGITILWIIALSILKWSSTIAHIHAKLLSLSYIFEHPLGYGLWSSGPAIHHNGTILPENYFIQLIIDIGRLWFGLWIVAIYYCLKPYLTTLKVFAKEKWQEYWYLAAYGIGCIALLAMWMFLHVFEDSMVNYAFFVVWWIYLGYLQTKKVSK